VAGPGSGLGKGEGGRWEGRAASAGPAASAGRARSPARALQARQAQCTASFRAGNRIIPKFRAGGGRIIPSIAKAFQRGNNDKVCAATRVATRAWQRGGCSAAVLRGSVGLLRARAIREFRSVDDRTSNISTARGGHCTPRRLPIREGVRVERCQYLRW
jgi:hypothetical protein